MTNPADVARRYAEAVAGGDDDALRALHAPGAKVWHNTDGVEQSIEENIALSQWLRGKVPDLAFEDVTFLATTDGFVRRHLMTGTGLSGPLAVPSCMVFTLDADGLITRAEEYLDSAALTPMRKAKA